MSQLFDDLFALDRKIANRWKIRTHDNVRHVLTAADIDFIFVDLIRSARNTDITENQGSAIVMLLNASMAANSARSSAALRRIIHYVNIWQRALRLNLQALVGEEQLQPMADFFRNGAVSRIMFKSPGTNISLCAVRLRRGRPAHSQSRRAGFYQQDRWTFHAVECQWSVLPRKKLPDAVRYESPG